MPKSRKLSSVLAAAGAVGLSWLFTIHLVAGALAQDRDDNQFYRFSAPRNPNIVSPARTIPTPIAIQDLHFQNGIPAAGDDGAVTISYRMPEPGFLTIRVLRQGTRELYLATVVNFAFRDTGRHTEIWDGRDYYGRLLDPIRTQFTYRIQAESLTSDSVPAGYQGVEYVEGMTQQELVDKLDFERHIHSWHEQKYENIPLLRITSPQPDQVVSGRFLVTSAIDRKRRGFGDKYGYGVRYYLDDELIHEEFYTPESDGNFAYELDTTAFEDGKHLLYIGLCDHNDHVTSHGLELVIRNLSAPAEGQDERLDSGAALGRPGKEASARAGRPQR